MISFALLLAAMAAFLASTIQTRLWVRGLFWIGGASALAGATYFVLGGGDHRGFFQLLEDALRNTGRLQQSVIWQSVKANHRNVSEHMLPLADVLLVIGTLAGLVALLAFTKGERLEKLVRPVLIGLMGAVFGGVLTLGVQALGLGGLAKNRSYAVYITKEKINDAILDGDTFRFGEISLRLYGVDAPEIDQICIDQELRPTKCGEIAKGLLADLMQDTLYLCEVEVNGNDRPQDALGRPLVTCHDPNTRPHQPQAHLARRIRDLGWAENYQQRRRDVRFITTLSPEHVLPIADGTCTVSPRVWRRNESARACLLKDQCDRPGWKQELIDVCDTVREETPRPPSPWEEKPINSDNPR
jgi:hypothetical protein